ncbi:hypothetical protein G1H11_18830 [Phytoactinopolyspora alkaliphila]|uniref:Uncharacterized protein n=1 Tax=Phytoactinopolyspora alkaliphila TaxID=1783498 RepID=A0A6N9YQZ7_9ACTN|nr:hypothetical protein [Phytoactinopolyspora alkaliphila]NED97355.1 hypothetical protein [Phytoactinopolyspora alkaliphila]
MNAKQIIRIVGSVFSATAAMKAFTKAKHEGDKLKMLDAGLAAASIAVTVAIVVRDVRGGDDRSRMVELGDDS